MAKPSFLLAVSQDGATCNEANKRARD